MLEEQIGSMEQKMESLNVKELDAASSVKKFVYQIDALDDDIISMNFSIQNLRKERWDEEQKTRELKGQINKHKRTLYNLLLTLHKIKKKRDNTNSIYNAIDNAGLKEKQVLQIYAKQSTEVTAELHEIYNEQNRLLRNIRNKQLKLEKLSAEQRHILQDLIDKKAKLEKFLSEVTGEKSRNLKNLGLLKSDKQELDSLLTKLWQSYLYNLSSQDINLGGLKGKKPLRQPVDGRIVKGFGEKEEGIIGSRYNGVVIATHTPSANVLAAHDGSVTFITRIKRFGNVVIIDHGKSDYTVYGMIDEIFTELGMNVRAGDIVGRTSSDLKDSKLYFEMRDKNIPANPVSYINELSWNQ